MDREKYVQRYGPNGEYGESDADLLWQFEVDSKNTALDTSANVWASAVRTYADWLHEMHGVSVTAASPAQVRQYLSYVSSQFAPNTQSGKYHGLQHFYEWLTDTEQIHENPAVRWDREDLGIGVITDREEQEAQADKDDYYWISKAEVQQLWQDENIPSPRLRNEILIKLLWYTGLRAVELSSIKLDPDDSEATGLHRDEGRIKVTNAKVDGTRNVYYPTRRMDLLLADWLDYGGRDALSPYASESDYLLLTDQSVRMRPGHISRIVKDAAKNAGVNEVVGTDVAGNDRWKVRAHCIRHSMATHHANILGTPIPLLGDALGHLKLQTTRKYIHSDDDALQRAMQDPWQ